ncbi:hypothetical protein V6669_12065 [Paenibacillus sp. Y5S-9]|uniref:hypothetical protein n=1 Tax=Paenibacillus sp. Y5S-9 TaxID=3122489 RepID=UPI0030CFF3B5
MQPVDRTQTLEVEVLENEYWDEPNFCILISDPSTSIKEKTFAPLSSREIPEKRIHNKVQTKEYFYYAKERIK